MKTVSDLLTPWIAHWEQSDDQGNGYSHTIFHLGFSSSLIPCIRRFRVTNAGLHFHRLFWRTKCYSPPGKKEESQTVSAISSHKDKDDVEIPKRTTPVFALEPKMMDLDPGHSADLVLRGFSHVPQVRSPPRAEPGEPSDPLPWARS